MAVEFLNVITSTHVGSSIIFACAVCHSFLVQKIFGFFEGFHHKMLIANDKRRKKYHVLGEICHSLSNIEVVFFVWLIPLFIWLVYKEGFPATIEYINTRNFSFPIYITALVLLIESKPILYVSERVLSIFARLGRYTPSTWWLILLTLGPLLTCVIKEPGAMIITSILLTKKFYIYQPTDTFKYATLGLLFSNISISGMILSPSSRAFFMVASLSNWDYMFVLSYFGWKALISILLSTGVVFLFFRKELKLFDSNIIRKKPEENETIPLWISLIHMLFVITVIALKSNMTIVVGVAFIFIVFHQITLFYQASIHLNKLYLVCIFFSSLILHGDLQHWWVTKMISGLSNINLMLVSAGMSSILDNAISNYLTFSIKYTNCFRYLVIAGAMSAGGLSIIGNVPNLIGFKILKPSFDNRISQAKLFIASLCPCCISLIVFWLLKNIPNFIICFF